MKVKEIKDLGHEFFYKKYYYQKECEFCNIEKKPIFHIHKDNNLFYIFFAGEKVWDREFYSIENLIGVLDRILLAIRGA